MRVDRTTVTEICRTIRVGVTGWGSTLRLCLIILVMTVAVTVVALAVGL